MSDFDSLITNYYTDFPSTWSFLGSVEDAQNISAEYQDQIHFLNQEGTDLITNYLNSSKMNQWVFSDPFKNYFSSLDAFEIYEGCDDKLKKWLYNRGIPFDKFVLVDNERSGRSVFLAWKMVIKYWRGLFFHEDLMIFDTTFNWGMFYSHHADKLIFGTNKIYDKTIEENKIILLNETIAKLNSNKI